MPKVSKDQISEVTRVEGYEGRMTEIDDYTVAFETYTADADLAPLLKGLPDDRCQARHWGVVLKGKVVYHYAEGSEEITAGEAYYCRPGHTPEIFEGTEVVEFSPTDEFKKTLEVALKNAEAQGS
ncbi:MAG: cupin domain-containing protein [Actinomycetota bacterium]